MRYAFACSTARRMWQQRPHTNQARRQLASMQAQVNQSIKRSKESDDAHMQGVVGHRSVAVSGMIDAAHESRIMRSPSQGRAVCARKPAPWGSRAKLAEIAEPGHGRRKLPPAVRRVHASAGELRRVKARLGTGQSSRNRAASNSARNC